MGIFGLLPPGAQQVLNGLGTITTGVMTFVTGITLLATAPVSWVTGIMCLLVGFAGMAMGLNEYLSGSIGVNYLREWTGMSEASYYALYIGINIACTICTIKGQTEFNSQSPLDRKLSGNCVGTLCFIAGTLVLTAEGYKKIEDIQVGDLVLAFDEQTGETAYKPVVHLFRNESKDWTGVTVNGAEIVSTPGHKYYLPETKEWISAAKLRVGTKVLLADGSYGTIEKVRDIHYDTPQTTYNFEVEDYHTYYVSTGVLVHNKNCGYESKTVAGPEKVGRYKDVRIDVEVGGSGQTNIHMQAKGLDKMYYDPNTGTFPTAPKKLRESSFVQNGIKRALDYIERRGL